MKGLRMELLIILGALIGVAIIGSLAVRSDRKSKEAIKAEAGFKKNATDKDKDGVVQEGTQWERAVSFEKPKPKAKPASKAAKTTKPKPKAKPKAKPKTKTKK